MLYEGMNRIHLAQEWNK